MFSNNSPVHKSYQAKHKCSKQARKFTQKPKPITELHGKHN